MKSYIVDVQHDKETDDYFIELNEEILKASGFNIGDELVWTKLENGSYQISKKNISNDIIIKSTNDFSESDWDNFKIWLKTMLSTNIVTVTFNKKDGTERVMRCTLKPDMIQITETKKKKTRKTSLDTLAVFDLEQDGWRSFTIKSVKNIQITL